MAQETSLRETMAESQLRRLDEAGLLDLLTAEIINGELVVRGTPTVRHQQVVARLLVALSQWAHEHGGEALPGDVGVEVDRDRQVRPDVVFVTAGRWHLVDDDGLRVPPDLVVEVASPGTVSLDLHEKRAIYQALGVPEYWVVDPRAGHVLVHRLDEGRYRDPHRVTAGDTLEPSCAPGLAVAVDTLLR